MGWKTLYWMTKNRISFWSRRSFTILKSSETVVDGLSESQTNTLVNELNRVARECYMEGQQDQNKSNIMENLKDLIHERIKSDPTSEDYYQWILEKIAVLEAK